MDVARESESLLPPSRLYLPPRLRLSRIFVCRGGIETEKEWDKSISRRRRRRRRPFLCGERGDSVLTRDPPFFFLPLPPFPFPKKRRRRHSEGTEEKTEEEEKKSLGGAAGRRVATLNRRKTGLDFGGAGARGGPTVSLLPQTEQTFTWIPKQTKTLCWEKKLLILWHVCWWFRLNQLRALTSESVDC